MKLVPGRSVRPAAQFVAVDIGRGVPAGAIDLTEYIADLPVVAGGAPDGEGGVGQALASDQIGDVERRLGDVQEIGLQHQVGHHLELHSGLVGDQGKRQIGAAGPVGEDKPRSRRRGDGVIRADLEEGPVIVRVEDRPDRWW